VPSATYRVWFDNSADQTTSGAAPVEARCVAVPWRSRRISATEAPSPSTPIHVGQVTTRIITVDLRHRPRYAKRVGEGGVLKRKS
jgi:hypothetical protein